MVKLIYLDWQWNNQIIFNLIDFFLPIAQVKINITAVLLLSFGISGLSGIGGGVLMIAQRRLVWFVSSMTEKVIKPIFFQKNNYSNLVDLDKKIKKLESLKIINLIMSYVVYRDNNKMLKYVSRNISIWKMCLLVLESYVRSKTINEKDIIENIQCSIMTGNTYIKELVELGIFYQEPDEKDKRKKNIFPSSAFLSEMNIFIEYLQNKISDLSL